MDFKKYLLMGTVMLSLSLFTACSDDDDPKNPDDDQEQNDGNDSDDDDNQTTADLSDPALWEGVTELTWPANSVVNLSTHYTVPEGKSLFIEPGVQIIVSTAGVGMDGTPIEFTVNGNLYCEGTAENPILFSVPEAERTEGNALKGMWGGIMANTTCAEMLIDHTIIEYTGGQVVEGSPAAQTEAYTAGDDAYPQITTNNINGKFVITNSILRYGWSDGIYLMGGQAIVMNNTFAGNGYDGAEAVNMKAGCKADVAGNVMYSPNTNGLKLSSSGQGGSRGQARIQAYNNTIINAGWRRDGEKGGCVYVEKNALVHVYNNLMVNCKFRAKTPSYTIPNNPEEGYDKSSVIDYNYYASGSQKSDIVWEDESGTAYAWQGYNLDDEDYNQGVVDAHSIIATENDSKDPLFVNYDINGVSLTNYIYNDAWDFHVQANSPVLSGAYSGGDANMAPYFSTEGLTVNGKTYTSPVPEAHFGAYGTK